MKKTLALTALGALLLCSSLAHAQATATASGQLTLSVGAEANISVDPTDAFSTAGAFANYTATTNFKYQVRTASTGTGTIQVAISAAGDFSNGSGGAPSANNPPTGDSLQITTCTAAVGTACSSALTINSTAQTVVSFGHSTHAGAPGAVSSTGAAGSVGWALTNDPGYPAGSYTATTTWTISAT